MFRISGYEGCPGLVDHWTVFSFGDGEVLVTFRFPTTGLLLARDDLLSVGRQKTVEQYLRHRDPDSNIAKLDQPFVGVAP